MEASTPCKRHDFPSEGIDELNGSAWQIRHTDPRGARELAQQALDQSGSLATHRFQYPAGAADALTTLAFLERVAGHPDRALEHCLAATNLHNVLPPRQSAVDCNRLIAWIHLSAGNTERSLEFASKALDLTAQFDAPGPKSAVLDTLAFVRLRMGQLQEALDDNEEALRLANVAEDRIAQSVALNNRSYMLLQSGDPGEAKASAEASLAIAREIGAFEQEIAVLDTLGDIYQSIGDLAGSERVLKSAEEVRYLGTNVLHPGVMVDLAKAHVRVGRLEEARQILVGAIERAQGAKALEVETDGGRLLAEVLWKLDRKDEAFQCMSHAYDVLASLRRNIDAVQVAVVESQHAAARMRQQYSTLVDVMTEGVAILELIRDQDDAPCDYRFLEINPAFSIQAGLTSQAVVGRLATDVFGISPPPFFDIVVDVVTSKASSNREYEALVPVRAFRAEAYAMGGSRVAIVLDDVTERNVAKRQLEASQRHFAKLFQASPLASSIARANDGTILDVNQNFSRDFGWSPEEVIGRTAHDLGWWHSRQERTAWLQRLESEGRVVSLPVFWPDKFGQRKRLSISSDIVDLDGEHAVFTFYVDKSKEWLRDEELEQYRKGLERLVDERTRDLAAATRRAESANRAKSAFLANMSHEIRTPLNAITGVAHLLRRDGLTEKQAQRLDKIVAAGHHLLEVINAILDISKIEADRVELAEDVVDLSNIVRSVCDMVFERANARGLPILTDIAAPSCRFVGDSTRLQQALLNYATNAVKFTHAGHILIRVEVDEQTDDDALLRFSVEDTGCGIPAEALPRLFQQFEQVDNSLTRTHGGTGLGLTITRSLARLMGGDAGVSSTPGVGSLFWFTVRLRKCTKEASSRTEMSPQGAYRVDVGANALRGARILVAEDEPISREVLVEILASHGATVVSAVDGVGALECFTAGDFALVMLDVQMPRMDGLEAARRIRAMDAKIPIIALTANAFDDDRQRCLAAGMTAFLPKPVDPDSLIEAIVRLLPRQTSDD
jgi:PAS domain S-box-containing protein